MIQSWKPSSWVLATSISGLVACGGVALENEPNPQGASQSQAGMSSSNTGNTTSSSSSSSAGGNANTSSSNGGSGGSPLATAGTAGEGNLDMTDPMVLTPPSICAVDELLQTADGYSVQVLISNDTSQTIYLGPSAWDCSGEPLFTVEDAAGEEVVRPGSCPLIPCAAQATGEPWACPATCPMEAAITLPPGQVLQLMYAGLYIATVPLTTECLNELDLAEGTCQVKHEITAGTFTFKAKADVTLDCDPTLTACDCQPSGNGGCSTPGALVPEPTLFAETTVELGPANGVFNPAPTNNAPAMMPGAGAAPPGAFADPVAFTPVVISFTDPL